MPERPMPEEVTRAVEQGGLKKRMREFMKNLTIALAVITPIAERSVMAGQPVQEREVQKTGEFERVRARIPGVNGEVLYVYSDQGTQDLGEGKTAALSMTAVRRIEDPDPAVKGDENTLTAKILNWQYQGGDSKFEINLEAEGFDPDKNPFGRIGWSDYALVDIQLTTVWREALTLQGMIAAKKGETVEARYLERSIRDSLKRLKENNPKIADRIKTEALDAILAPLRDTKAASAAPVKVVAKASAKEAPPERPKVEVKAAVQFSYDNKRNVTKMTVAGELRGAAPETLLAKNWRTALKVQDPDLRNIEEDTLLADVRSLAVYREVLKTLEPGTKEYAFAQQAIKQKEHSIEQMAKPGKSLLK